MTSEKTLVKLEDGQNPAVPQSFLHLTKNMENELEKRKSDWETEVSKMQHDFFQMKTPSNQKQIAGGKTTVVDLKADKNVPRRHKGSGAAIFDISHAKTLYCDQPDGTKLFKLRFDVKGYEPNEISIKAEGQKLVVTAKTEDERGENKAVKQFNRQVDLPPSVDPDQLVSFLSADGILSVEAPVEYEEEDEGEEVEVVYPDSNYPPGIEPPLYEHVVEGEAPGSYSSRETFRTGVPSFGHSSHHHHSGGVPGAGYSFSSQRGIPGGGGGGYSYSSSSSSVPVAPRISYEFHSSHCGPGHHDCHHKEGPRRPLETHVKRVKNPPPKVDYFKQVTQPRHYSSYSSHSTPGLMGAMLGHSMIQPSGSSGPTGGSSYSSSISSSSSHRTPTTIINENYRYNEPSIVGENEGGKRLKLMVDIGRDYEPEDVQVTLYGGKTFEVKAQRNQTVDGRTSKSQFSRDFHSPEALESHTARASLAKDGKLYIGACLKGNKDQDKVIKQVIADLPEEATPINISLQ